MPDDFTCQWRASGWERVNWAYLPILFLNLSSPRLAKTIPYVILFCLMSDDFTRQWRASGWIKVNKVTLDTFLLCSSSATVFASAHVQVHRGD